MRLIKRWRSSMALAIVFSIPFAKTFVVAGDTSKVSTELFAVDVGPMVAKFGKSQIVSKPPIIGASFYQMDSSPRVVVPEEVEAYLLEPNDRNNDYSGYRIVGRKPLGKSFDGEFFLLRRHPDHPRDSVLVRLDFHVNATQDAAIKREDFSRAKGRYFQRLWSEQMAGSAMFRHLATTSLKAAGETARSTGPNWPINRNAGVDQTIALMSGGRAVSENLQLDAQLALPDQSDGKQLPLDDVAGIQVRPINWDTFLKDEPTELDAVSKLIPHDQYAVFLPSFDALAEMIDRGGEIAKPAVQWFEPQSRKTDVIGFYQKQLALPLNAITRFAGNTLIGEVAVTGSDPYFRTGTDVAVLMRSNPLHSDQPDLLLQSILAQVGALAAQQPGAKKVEHSVDEHTFTEWSTENRKLCSFVGRVDDTVVVSNSLHQMLQVLKCHAGIVQNMHDLDEYRFFRQRYQRDTETESALIVITDAAIRRWCGPKWRIGASRRTRARATIAELTMSHADALVNSTLTGVTQIHSSQGMPNVGELKISADGVLSTKYGTLDFQTPIAELDLDSATQEEIDLYTNWRTRYERRWRRSFDPIALQLSLTHESMHADLSVIPLMVQSDYRQFMRLVGDMRLIGGSGDPHAESLAEITVAIDTKSTMMQLGRTVLATGGAEIDLLAWIDGSATLYFDKDDQWIKRSESRSPWQKSPEDLIRDLPVGLFIPSKDNFRMAAFVVAVRAALQQFAPNMFQWETVKYHGYDYVVATALPTNSPLGDPDLTPQLFYVTTGKGFTLSLNRGVVEHVIDRHLVPKKQDDSSDEEKQGEADVESAPQVIMTATGKGIEIMSRTNYQSGLGRMNRISWSNIPILNHLRSRYPGRDPHTVYQTLFRQTLQEPSGGNYVWDPERGTYVSTLQGYHLEPQAGPPINPVLEPNDKIRTTILFKDSGLRATLDVQSAAD